MRCHPPALVLLSIVWTLLSPRLASSDPVVVVPAVQISSLGHFYEPWTPGFVQMGDGVSFPCGAVFGTCSGPGFTAAIETSSTIHLRFEAPPGYRFRVTYDPEFVYQAFLIDASWETGASDTNTSPHGVATAAFENLSGTPPEDGSNEAWVSDNGEFINLSHEFILTGDFTFTAVSFTFTPTHALPGTAKTYGGVVSSSQRSFVAGGVAATGAPDRGVLSLEPITSTVVVPTVEITSLGHSFFDAEFFVGIADGVTFPCGSGIGTCSGPGFAATIETGETIAIRFEAPPNQRFHVTRHAGLPSQQFVVDAVWQTGVGDTISTSVYAPVVFEGLSGTPPVDSYNFAGVGNAGEAIRLIRHFEVVGDFTFEAATFTITPTNALPGVLKTYGSVGSFSEPSFYSGGSGNPGTPDAVLMSLESVATHVPLLGTTGRGVLVLALFAATALAGRGWTRKIPRSDENTRR